VKLISIVGQKAGYLVFRYQIICSGEELNCRFAFLAFRELEVFPREM
jgi:hypothetical protein